MQTEKLFETNPWKSMFDAAEHFSSDFMATRDQGIESARESFDEC
jgi:virulence-associated protein VagC